MLEPPLPDSPQINYDSDNSRRLLRGSIVFIRLLACAVSYNGAAAPYVSERMG